MRKKSRSKQHRIHPIRKHGAKIFMASALLILGVVFAQNNFTKENCEQTTNRPCFDKQTGKKIMGVESKGGENAFEACIKNAAPNEHGQFNLKTSKCEEETAFYCYEGKSGVFLRKFDGTCKEQARCPNVNVPDLVSVGSFDLTPGYYPARMRSIIHGKNSNLFVAGETFAYDDTLSSYVLIPKVYKSTNGGQSWSSATLPYSNSETMFNMARKIVEDPATGTLYAGGTRFWKSTDEGSTWQVIPTPFSVLTSSSARNVFVDVLTILKDNSLVAATGFGPADLIKSTDGGASWQKILSHPTYIVSLVEASDGSLIFVDGAHDNGYGGVYRYSNGSLQKVFSVYFVYGYNYEIERPLIKGSDGTLYLSMQKSLVTSGYTVKPEDNAVITYSSADNGLTWTEKGDLPTGMNPRPMIAGSDGNTLFATADSVCYGATIYKSEDKAKTWIPIADAGPTSTGYGFIFSILAITENLGKILSVGDKDVVYSNP